MTALRWEDTTSWSRSDDSAARKRPRTWEARADAVRLVVTRHMHLAPSDWMLRCDEMHIESDLGGDVSAEVAQERLVAMVRARLKAALAALGGSP